MSDEEHHFESKADAGDHGHALQGIISSSDSLSMGLGRKDSYKLDLCYGQEETTGDIFSREIKPLLEGILKGGKGCVIAYGAQGSGKTQLVQGSEENPGLALMFTEMICTLISPNSDTISLFKTSLSRSCGLASIVKAKALKAMIMFLEIPQEDPRNMLIESKVALRENLEGQGTPNNRDVEKEASPSIAEIEKKDFVEEDDFYKNVVDFIVDDRENDA
ncbi:uncharacterized protein A4U43_C06F10330 [Asparagus officinalis]|uniref:Kinesin motor domain-containing protein n=1 Tax=Asparagus officinalis TaxID=4686 RepID=A0A5P1EKV2_ASPOF|nr:uncharacterized protein A4U43_C06F10330 [Asparagus officinalis]